MSLVRILGAALLALAVSTSAQAPAPYTIAFASFAPLNAELFVAAADGSGATPSLPSPAQDWNASFARDGRWIAFTSTRNGSADVYRAHPDGSGLERLTDDPAFDDQGALSPDGAWIAFSSDRDAPGLRRPGRSPIASPRTLRLLGGG